MAKIEAKFKEQNAVLYCVSNEKADKLLQMREKQAMGETFVFLSDPEGKLAAHYAGKYPQGYLKPATVVVGKDKKVLWATSLDNYAVRPAAEKVLEEVMRFGG